MARRMISDEVIGKDKFLGMSKAAQVLYFHLVVHADDYGFVESPKAVMAITKSTPKNLEELERNGFVITFASGVIVVSHWFAMNVFSHSDRIKPTQCQEEYSQVEQIARVWVRKHNAFSAQSAHICKDGEWQ